jgi:hypothetical protein
MVKRPRSFVGDIAPGRVRRIAREQLGARLGGAMLGVPQWRLNQGLGGRGEPRPVPFVLPKKKGRK